MTRWLESDTLSNQDISSALAIGVYTADADRLVKPQLLVDAVAGNGDYVYYVTLQVAGAGSSYVMGPKTTHAAASGETAIGAQGDFIFVRAGDVLTVYVDGLAGDVSTPDTTVRWCELAVLQPATPGQALAINYLGAVPVYEVLDDAITSASIANNAITAAKIATGAISSVTFAAGAITSSALSNNAITAAKIATGAITADKIATDAIASTKIAEDAKQSIGGYVRIELATELAHLDADVSSVGSGLTAQDVADAGKLAPSAGAAAAGSVYAELDLIIANPGGLTAQETANAVHNLLPVGTPAVGSIGDKLNDILDVTEALDVSAVTQVAASNAGHLTITIGLTFDEGVTGLTIPADWVSAIWTLKQNVRDIDLAALVQLRATNPTAETDGLQRLNGAAPAAPITADDGALTVTQATGRIDMYLTDEMTAQLGAAMAIGWDVKFIDAAGDSTGRRGTADVVLTETKSTA